jgi:hypothetical protein
MKRKQNLIIISFLDDYRLTSCMGILKYALQKHRGEPDIEIDVHITSAKELDLIKAQVVDNESEDNDGRLSVVLSRTDSASKNGKSIEKSTIQKPELLSQNDLAAIEPMKSTNDPQRSNSKIGQSMPVTKPYRCSVDEPEQQDTKQMQNSSKLNTNRNKKKSLASIVPCEAIEFAIDRIQEYIDFKESNEIDRDVDTVISDEKWSQFYEWFYMACQYGVFFVVVFFC